MSHWLYDWETVTVSGDQPTNDALNQRAQAGWEFVPPAVAAGRGLTLFFRRVRGRQPSQQTEQAVQQLEVA